MNTEDPNLPHGSDLPPAEEVICSQGNAPHMCDYPEELAYTGDTSWWLLPIAIGLVALGAALRRLPKPIHMREEES